MFSLDMESLGNVKSIAIGGRPTKNLMQGIGGTRGALAFKYDDIYSRAQEIFSDVSKDTAANLTNLRALSELPILRSSDNKLGVRDQMLPDHFQDGMPAQMLNLSTPYNLFYTREKVVDVARMWAVVTDSAFGGKPCSVGAVGTSAQVKVNARGQWAVESRRVLVRKAEEARRYLEAVRRNTGLKPRAGPGSGSTKSIRDGRKVLPDISH